MRFTVIALELMPSSKPSGKVTLKANDKRTIYDSQMFIHVPLADLPLFCLGMELDFDLPDYAVRP